MGNKVYGVKRNYLARIFRHKKSIMNLPVLKKNKRKEIIAPLQLVLSGLNFIIMDRKNKAYIFNLS